VLRSGHRGRIFRPKGRSIQQKFEARNPKFETISNDQMTQCSKPPQYDRSFEFCDFKFEFVSGFDIRISSLGRACEKTKDKK